MEPPALRQPTHPDKEPLAAVAFYDALAQSASVDPEDVLRKMQVPEAKIAATLRRERRKLNMLLFGSIAGDMLKTARKFQKLRDAVLAEIDARPLDEMEVKELLGLLRAADDYLSPIFKAVALTPPHDPEEVPASKTPIPVNPEQLASLMVEIDKLKHEAQVYKVEAVDVTPTASTSSTPSSD